MADVIIIGAGYAGMSAAALLASAGRKVIVLEASDTIGGRARSVTDEAGYVWEYGAHSHRLAHKGIANDVFRRLGEAIDFLPEAKDAKLIFRGRLWERPAGPAGFLKTPMLSFGARLALLVLLIRIQKADPRKEYDKTLNDFYKASFRNPDLEAFLPFLGMTIMCPSPDKVSAGEVIEFLQRVFKAKVGVGEPRGGSAQLFSKLKKHIDPNGEIHLHEKAEEIMTENAGVTGVKTDKATYSAKNIIFAARLPLLPDLIDNRQLPKATLDYAKNLENSSGLTIDFITDRPVTNIRSSILGVDIPVWVRFQSNADDSFTPPGKYLSTWGIMLPWHFDGNQKTVEETEKRLKATISTIFPDFMSRVVKERKVLCPS